MIVALRVLVKDMHISTTLIFFTSIFFIPLASLVNSVHTRLMCRSLWVLPLILHRLAALSSCDGFILRNFEA